MSMKTTEMVINVADDGFWILFLGGGGGEVLMTMKATLMIIVMTLITN